MFWKIIRWLKDFFWDYHITHTYGGTTWKSFNIKKFVLFILFLIYGFTIIYLYIK